MADTEIKASADAPQPQPHVNGSTSTKRAASASPPRSLSNEEQGEASTSKAAAAGAGADRQGSAASKKESSDAAADKRRRKAQSKFVNRLRKETARTIEKFGEDPIYHEAVSLLGQEVVEQLLSAGRDLEQKFQRGEELDVEIALLGAHGNGIAVVPGHEWVVSVPKALPGDKVRVRVKQNDRLHTKATIVSYLHKSTELREVEPFCKYFQSCAGCQYQTMTYERQLEIKRRVVENAFKHYSALDPALLPSVRPTMASPKDRAYRTKLTPHFELPREVRAYQKELKKQRGAPAAGGKGKGASAAAADAALEEEEEGGPLPVKPKVAVPIGFDSLEDPSALVDIEECPIATQTINDALPVHRQRIRDTIHDFPNGATLLVRDSLRSFHDGADGPCDAVTDLKKSVREMVGDVKFESPAGAFFQNNRSILPDLLAYVEAEILATRGGDDSSSSETKAAAGHYLVDAYCGSGLFSLCLAHLFEKVAGVEISTESIRCAQTNAKLNGIGNAVFLAGNAENIFGTIAFAPERTTVVIDPPRRGCDDAFIQQLVKLAPRSIVYVSCNVHTQARDVGAMIRADPSYKVVSIRGADLFPQTNHVEGICVLRRS